MGIPGKMYTRPDSSREWSYTFFDQDVVKYFAERHPSPETSILDIGAGGGKYKYLLYNYPKMDAVEKWEPYVEKLGLKNQYREVFVTDILDFDFDFYDVIIMGDVLEHIPVDKAVGLMKRLMQKCHDMVVVLPYMNASEVACEGNPNEIHRQADLTQEVIESRYPMLQKYTDNEISGMYVFNPSLRRNYFVQTFYDSGDPNKNAFYRRMQEISYKTFSNNIQEPFFYKLWEEPYTKDVPRSIFGTFRFFCELWNENANIFYADMDTLCVKPLEIFGKYPQFSLFWTSDPPSKPDFPKYMNSGTSYYPAEMPESVMKYGIELMNNHLDSNAPTSWGFEQEMYTRMLNRQGIPFEKFMDNKLNWMYLPSRNTTGLNEIEIQDAQIIHFHSSRDLRETVKIMEEYDSGGRTFN